MKRRIVVVFLFVLLGAHVHPTEAPPLAERTPEGFAVPQPGKSLEFPRDHGSHPEFRLEWWYITGHLFAADDDRQRFGFQATFFRSARRLPNETRSADDGDDAFGDAQLFLAHMALLDAANERFLHEERLNRDGWDAAAAVGRLDLVNGNWTLTMSDPGRETMSLAGSVRGDARFTLDLAPEKSRVIFGRDGVSRKGADPTAASYYVTFPRLAVTGTLQLDGRELAVSGRAWMDHEISSSQLAPGQTGWDWCSLQLDDGWDVMAYRLRREDGSSDPFSTLAWIAPDGKVTPLGADDFRWEPLEHWTSPQTGARYPVRFRLHVARSPRERGGAAAVFDVRPVFRAQELTGGIGGIAYWEGACDVLDERGRVIGRAFTELTGYAESLAGKF